MEHEFLLWGMGKVDAAPPEVHYLRVHRQVPLEDINA